MKYAIYDPAGDAEAMPIVQTVSGTETDAMADAEGLALSYCRIPPSARDDTHYIKRSTGKTNKRPRTACTPSVTTLAADGMATLTLSQMPPETVVTVSGPSQLSFTASGSEQLTFTVPGVYTITAQAAFPRLPKEISINAT